MSLTQFDFDMFGQIEIIEVGEIITGQISSSIGDFQEDGLKFSVTKNVQLSTGLVRPAWCKLVQIGLGQARTGKVKATQTEHEYRR